MLEEIEKIIREVLKKITPARADRARMEKVSRKLESKVSVVCAEFGVDAIVRLEGSVAKDTWLREDPDIDVFIRLPTSVPSKSLGEIGLKVARKATQGQEQIER